MFRLNRTLSIVCMTLGCSLLGASSAHAQASPSKECSAYYDAVTGGATPEAALAAPALPEGMLKDAMTALPCLARAIGALKPEIEKGGSELSPALRAKFLRATGAVRTIMGVNKPEDELRAIIKAFRDVDDLDVAAALSFGARAADYNTRLNSMLVFSNVVDNTTVCVPIDHLYDIALEKDDDSAVKGRANLLAVVNVVAPWAYKENYRNINNVRGYWTAKAAENPKFRSLNVYLQNIKARLESQKEDSNSTVDLPIGLRQCKAYTRRYAPADMFSYE
jgi:hypothetical protein